MCYHDKLEAEILVAAIQNAGYVTKPEWISEDRKRLPGIPRWMQFLLILACILLLNLLMERILGYSIFNVIPTIDSSITYGMLIVTGFMTSIHCISMCGAINLTAAANERGTRKWSRPLLYNLGRVISYTVIGGLVGAIGSIIMLSTYFSAAIIILAGIMMFLMALNMLGIVPFRLPHFCSLKSRSRNAFIIGLLNGLMPCGPLQSMQLYALSTGSLYLGAMSMLLFGIGTVPLMLCMGFLSNVLSGHHRVVLNQIASALILVLSLTMVGRGINSLGLTLPNVLTDSVSSTEQYDGYLVAEQYDGYQQVEFDLSYSGYADIVVKAGVTVRMIIYADSSTLTGCNSALQCTALNFSSTLTEGENIIEFTAAEGTWTYTCWMSMLKNTIVSTTSEELFEVH